MLAPTLTREQLETSEDTNEGLFSELKNIEDRVNEIRSGIRHKRVTHSDVSSELKELGRKIVELGKRFVEKGMFGSEVQNRLNQVSINTTLLQVRPSNKTK